MKLLFESLLPIKNQYNHELEICVSNNASTDYTSEVIEAWSSSLSLKSIVSPSNLGATQNAINVCALATGRYILVIGDDDAIIHAGFDKLISLLQYDSSLGWLLLDVVNSNGDSLFPASFRPGLYNTFRSKLLLLRTGLYPFGFVGMHLFPRHMAKVYSRLGPQQAWAWGHLALLLRYVLTGNIYIFNAPVVIQAAAGPVLYWSPSSWPRVNIRKIDIISEVQTTSLLHSLFLSLLILRELYSVRNAKDLILWKLLESSDFSSSVLLHYIFRYGLVGPLAPLTVPHLIMISLLRIIPTVFIRGLLSCIGKHGLIAQYESNTSRLSEFDGIARGL